MNFTPEQLVKAKAATTAEELIALAKTEGIEALSKKLAELTEEELAQTAGGVTRTPRDYFCPNCNKHSDIIIRPIIARAVGSAAMMFVLKWCGDAA